MPHARRILRIEVCQTLPAAPDPQYVVVDFAAPVDNRLDDGIQSGDIAPTGQYAYTLVGHNRSLMAAIHPRKRDSALKFRITVQYTPRRLLFETRRSFCSFCHSC